MSLQRATTHFDPGPPADDSLTGYKRLAQAILLHAVHEARSAAKLEARLDAILFLVGPEAAYLSEALDIQKSPAELLTAGILRAKNEKRN